MALAKVRIPRLQARFSVVDREGRPTVEFLRALNDMFQAIGASQNQIIDAVNLINQARAAADAAQAAADQAQEAVGTVQAAVVEVEAAVTSVEATAVQAQQSVQQAQTEIGTINQRLANANIP